MTEGPQRSVPDPPDIDALRTMPADAWGRLLTAARRALHRLEPHELTPRLEQLRSLPTARLVSGRGREDLGRALARVERVWSLTAEILLAGGEEDRSALRYAKEAAPAPPSAHDLEDDAGSPDSRRRVRELEATVDRLRARHGEFVAERDDARRRASGLEARLSTEQERISELDAQVSALSEERDALREELAAAADERERALDRLRRQHAAQVRDLEVELRDLRRREQEHSRRQHRERVQRDAAQRRAAREVEQHLSQTSRRPGLAGGRQAVLGRPSRLPPGIGPETTEAAASLVVPGQEVLVDGYNVTKSHKDHLPLEQQRIWLVRTLEVLATRTEASITIVFDGAEEVVAPRPGRRVNTVFSRGGSADDQIVEMVKATDRAQPILVVTDDRELRDRVREQRTDVVGTRPFLGLAT